MKCIDRERLFAYALGLHESREEAGVRAHLAECAACRGAVEQYRKLDAVLDEWKPTGPSTWFDTRLGARLRQAEKERAGFFGLRPIQWLAPAVALVALVAVSTVILRMKRPVAVPKASVPPAVQVATPAAPTVATSKAGTETESGQDELSLYKNLPVLEDYDLLADFDVLSELPKAGKQVEN